MSFYRILAQLEDDVAPCESQMDNWKTNLEVMAVKEEQYIQQYKKYEVNVFFFQFLHTPMVIGKSGYIEESDTFFVKTETNS